MKLLGRRFSGPGRSSWCRRTVAALLLLSLGLVAAPGSAGTARAPRAPGALPPHADVVTIGRTPVANPIASGFAGLSLEYGTVADAERAGASGVDPVLAQLIRNLAPGQTPVVRIGGDSTDWTWWPVGAMKRPHGVTFNLTPDWIGKARALATSAGARLILGINLETNNTTIASTEARHLAAGI